MLTAVHEVDVPAAWADRGRYQALRGKDHDRKPKLVDFVDNVMLPVDAQKGDVLTTCRVMAAAWTAPSRTGTAAYEKRGVAVDVPEWTARNCIQCNQCSLVCPHAAIRPWSAMTDEDAKASRRHEAAAD